MKSIKRTGFGPNLFDEWRYLDKGEAGQDNSKRPLNPDFALNQARFQGAEILLARDNFACGSSREHAPWALYDFGIRALVAPSYADIFFGNACKNGLLPLTLPAAVVDQLFHEVAANEGYKLTVDLLAQSVTTPSGALFKFDFKADLKERLLYGLDDIGLSLKYADDIKAYEAKKKLEAPWLFT